LVKSADQLSDWAYDYHALFYAIDFGTEVRSCFDYALTATVQHIGPSSGVERARRMAAVSSAKIGRYACLSSAISSNPHYADIAPQLETYVLTMVEAGMSAKLERKHKRVAECIRLLESLSILSREGDALKVSARKVLEAAREGVNPIEAKIVLDVANDKSLKEYDRQRCAYLMTILASILWCE
jgi:hypothetical protein